MLSDLFSFFFFKSVFRFRPKHRPQNATQGDMLMVVLKAESY